MPLKDPKSGKREPAEGQKEGQEKAPKSYEFGVIGEGCESKKSKLLGMRARTRGKLRLNAHLCRAHFWGTIIRLRE
mgnify:CR=1 FL=1